LAAVVVYAIWRTWLGDVGETPPLYLSEIMGLVVVLAIWSTGYALLGRLLGGRDRFFKHFLIVCCAYVGGMMLDHLLKLLAFSFYDGAGGGVDHPRPYAHCRSSALASAAIGHRFNGCFSH
jgi:hypothetical protein